MPVREILPIETMIAAPVFPKGEAGADFSKACRKRKSERGKISGVCEEALDDQKIR
jgi:hypothetical protein